MKQTRFRLLLASISGILLGLAFPPIPSGITVTFAFLPFFILFESIDTYGRAIRYSYLTFFIFNFIALYWTGGIAYSKDTYQMVAGILLLLMHPFFFCVPVLGWVFIRRQFGFKISINIFPILWVAFEYLHSMSDLSFPWLTLGNTQTYDLSIIQIASIFGVYGISFWLLWLNVIVFYFYKKIAGGEWKSFSFKSIAVIFCIMLLYFLPKIYGTMILAIQPESHASKINIAVIQPNMDTFEKWLGAPEAPLDLIQKQTSEIMGKNTDLLLWPETAIPFYVLHPANRFYFEKIKQQVDTLNINLLTGIPDVYYYRESDKVPKSSKVSVNGERYDTYNSSILLQSHRDEVQKYSKIILVPFAERVPFSEELSILNAMQWNFGLGGWGHGRDTTIFRLTDRNENEYKFSNMICYESVFPSLVSAFVRKGAQFLTVITNDSWWGNTSGAYQHKQFASLRAVENRRWIVQCANGGISCFIDPYGRFVQQTDMYTQATIFQEIEPMDDITFYTRYGELIAKLCLVFSAFFIVAGMSKIFYNKIRMRQIDEIH